MRENGRDEANGGCRPVAGRETADGHVHGHVHDGSGPLLDHEKLDVFRVAVEFRAVAMNLLTRGHAGLRDQLDRASSSVILNLAEGAGRRARGDKRRHYSIARGSAAECGAVLSVLRASGVIAEADHVLARQLVVRVVQMLSRLERRMA